MLIKKIIALLVVWFLVPHSLASAAVIETVTVNDGQLTQYIFYFETQDDDIRDTILSLPARSATSVAGGQDNGIQDDGVQDQNSEAEILPLLPNYENVSISELMPAPETGEPEWLELYNNSTEAVDLTGCYLQEGAGKKFIIDLTVASSGYLIIETSSLNNGGDVIDLYCNEELIDSVAYGDWAGSLIDAPEKGVTISLVEDQYCLSQATQGGGNICIQDTNLNLPASSATSVAGGQDNGGQDDDIRDSNIQDTNLDLQDNGIQDDDIRDAILNLQDDGVQDQNSEAEILPLLPNYENVFISELMPAPETGEPEWIELYNNSTEAVDLTGCYLQEGAGKKFTIGSEIASHGYLIVETSSLNNGGDVIDLYCNEELIDSVAYGDWAGSLIDAPEKGVTISLVEDQYCLSQATQGGGNICIQDTNLSLPARSATSVAGGQDDGVQDTNIQDEGVQDDDIRDAILNLQDDDVQEDSVQDDGIQDSNLSLQDEDIQDNGVQDDGVQDQNSEAETLPLLPNYENVSISELMPAPETGKPEWLELYNNSTEAVDLTGCYLQEGAGKKFTIDSEIASHGYLIVETSSLNNGGDVIDLYCNEELIDSVAYGDWAGSLIDAPEKGVTISLVEDQYCLSQATQGGGNICIQDDEDLSLKTQNLSEDADGPFYNQVLISQINQQEKGTQIVTQGQVTVLPEVFGKRYFYVNGSQVYFSKSDWPDLKLGDVLQISGKISESRNEKRILISQKEDLQVVDNQVLEAPQEVNSSEIGEYWQGYLVQTNGELLEKSGSRLYLADDKGEFVVYLKKNTGISSSLYEVGDQLKISGILSQYDDEYRIMPRSEADIQNISWQEDPVVGASFVPEVEQQSLPANDSKQTVQLALMIAILTLLVFNSGYFIYQNRHFIAKLFVRKSDDVVV